MFKQLKDSQQNKIIDIILLLILIFVPLRELLSYYISNYTKIIADVLVLFILILTLIKKRFKLEKSDYILGLFFIIAIINTVLLKKLSITYFFVQFRSIILYYVVYITLRAVEPSNFFVKNILLIIKILIYSFLFLAIFEKIFFKTIFFPPAWKEAITSTSNFVRVYGVFNNPNTYSAFVLFSFLFIYQFNKSFFNKRNIFLLSSITLSIILTMSRSTIIFFVLSIIFIYYNSLVSDKTKFKEINVIFLKTFAIFILMLSTVLLFSNISSNYIPVKSSIKEKNIDVSNRFVELSSMKIVKDSSTNGRIYKIQKGLEIYKDNLILGSGLGTYGSSAALILGSPIAEKYNFKNNLYADNEYIKILVETGTGGALLFIIFILTIGLKYKNEQNKIFLIFVVLGLGMFYNIFEIQIIMFYFWLMLAIPKQIHENGNG